jgi:hypothetical protein
VANLVLNHIARVGWTSYESIHWMCPIVAGGLSAVGGCLIFNCAFSYESDAYPQYAASVLAGTSLHLSAARLTLTAHQVAT